MLLFLFLFEGETERSDLENFEGEINGSVLMNFDGEINESVFKYFDSCLEYFEGDGSDLKLFGDGIVLVLVPLVSNESLPSCCECVKSPRKREKELTPGNLYTGVRG